MAKNTTHTQCRLRRGNMMMVSWIPSKFAVVDKYLKLRDRETGGWVNGWQVIETYTTMDSSYINERSRDWKRLPSLDRQRKRK